VLLHFCHWNCLQLNKFWLRLLKWTRRGAWFIFSSILHRKYYLFRIDFIYIFWCWFFKKNTDSISESPYRDFSTGKLCWCKQAHFLFFIFVSVLISSIWLQKKVDRVNVISFVVKGQRIKEKRKKQKKKYNFFQGITIVASLSRFDWIAGGLVGIQTPFTLLSDSDVHCLYKI
jgi:hypothetical protein